MHQANELGGSVRKGERSTIIVFWKVNEGPNEKAIDAANEKPRRRFLLRYYRIFKIEQCDLPQALLNKLPKIETHEHDPIETAERIIAGMPNPPEIQHAAQRPSIVRSPIGLRYRHANCSLARRNSMRRRCTRRFIAL